MNVNLFNQTEAEQFKILNIVNILPLTYRFLYHYLCFIFIIMNNCKLELNQIINKNTTRRNLRSAFILPKINKDIKLYSLLVTLLKTLNLFNTKNLQITHCKYSKFKIDMKIKIKEIYGASCFKMDPIFVLEFDKKKYYETLNEQKILMQNETNNSND
jgi:hypothetical protein